MRPLPGDAGVIRADQVSDVIRQGSEHNPHTAVVAFENTHNAAGGAIFPIDEAKAIAKVCRDRNVSVHLDGARLFNAQAATGTPGSGVGRMCGHGELLFFERSGGSDRFDGRRFLGTH